MPWGLAEQLGQVWLGLDTGRCLGPTGPCPTKVRTGQRCLWIGRKRLGWRGLCLDPDLRLLV